MKSHATETIAAIATPAGEGALAVIRVSGTEALELTDRVFRGRRALSSAAGYTVHHGRIVTAEGGEVDEVLATVFRSPHSYTGEDAVEISCHGGILVSNAVLQAVLQAGARLAEPGEFTRRAFLNGKMDLSRAEAVAALIASSSERAHRASLEQLHGRLSSTVDELREGLVSLCALLEIDLDFSEEGITVITRESIERKIRETMVRMDTMADTFKSGRLYRDGVSVVIAGKPNAGKSSVFNALLKDSRAIVTPIAGTTRDYLEESITLEGVLFRLTDTAGLREGSADPIEMEGIARSRRSLERCDIVLLIDDVSDPQGDLEGIVRELGLSDEQVLLIGRNKIDLVSGGVAPSSALTIASRPAREVRLSARTGEGVHVLASELLHAVSRSAIATHETVQIINERHYRALLKASQSLSTALESLRTGATNEFVAFDVRESIASLGEITGAVTSDDVLNSVFSTFCIGK